MQKRQSSSCAALVVFLAVLVLLSACCTPASAVTIPWVDYVISEDVIYWVRSAETMQVYTTMDWSTIPSQDVPLVKVQQTVYNQDYTALLKSMRTIPSEVNGFLYAYSVSNLNVLEKLPVAGNPDQFVYSGIKEFHVNWAVQAVTVTTSMETPANWDPFYLSSGPTWMYRGAGPGMMPGETVGGLWAFSNIGRDCITQARVKYGANGSIEFWGQTTGPDPAPEPGGIIVLLSGTAGLFGFAARKRRK